MKTKIILASIASINSIHSVVYLCTVSEANKQIKCECQARGATKPVASAGFTNLGCESDKGYCSSDAKGLPNGKVKIIYCTYDKIGLVHKRLEDGVYQYSEINSFDIANENGKTYKSGNINSVVKDDKNTYF